LNDGLTLQELLEVQAHFGLPSPALVEKDFHIVEALVAVAVAELKSLVLAFCERKRIF
jgi:hypothetical protein